MNQLNNNNERYNYTDFGGHFCRPISVEFEPFLAHWAQ